MVTTIRALVADDIPDIKSVIDENELFPSEMIDDMVSSFLIGKTEEHKWIVAIDNKTSKLIGLAYFVPEKMTSGTWNLLLIAVRPAVHGKGVGKQLVASVENVLRSISTRILLVETSSLAEYEKTRQFYVKIGFEQEARIREFYQEGEDKIVFRKKLM